jgi:hypothetical protein
MTAAKHPAKDKEVKDTPVRPANETADAPINEEAPALEDDDGGAILPLPLYDQAPVLHAVEAVAAQLVIMNFNLEQIIKALEAR